MECYPRPAAYCFISTMLILNTVHALLFIRVTFCPMFIPAPVNIKVVSSSKGSAKFAYPLARRSINSCRFDTRSAISFLKGGRFVPPSVFSSAVMTCDLRPSASKINFTAFLFSRRRLCLF